MTMTAKPAFDDTIRMAAMRGHATTKWRTWLTRLTEPHILFPALTILVLGVIWTSTFNLIKVERTNAETAAAATALEQVKTYDAQVVRALREIDQTLKLVKYVAESKGAAAALSDLKVRTLLPPDVLFVVRVMNGDGAVLASTRPAEVHTASDPAALSALRAGDSL